MSWSSAMKGADKATSRRTSLRSSWTSAPTSRDVSKPLCQILPSSAASCASVLIELATRQLPLSQPSMTAWASFPYLDGCRRSTAREVVLAVSVRVGGIGMSGSAPTLAGGRSAQAA